MAKIKHQRDIYHLMDFLRGRTEGRYQIPKIAKEDIVAPDHIIDFSSALSAKDLTAGVHFFLDDEKFERIWYSPQRYISVLKRFSCVFSPDFSLYRDMPLALKPWNVYRSRLLGQMMQRAGIHVIPSVSWAGKNTFRFCFSGLPHSGTIALSTVGILNNDKKMEFFIEGCKKMCASIKPKRIFLYGNIPPYTFPGVQLVQYKYSRFDWKNKG